MTTMKLRLGAVVLAALAFAAGGASAQTSVGYFSGPGVGQGLDLSGSFDYAVQFSTNNVRTISGVNFWGYQSVAGLGITTHYAVDNWGLKPEYGTSTDANALEDMMHDVVYYSLANFSLSLSNLTIGAQYKLQLLLSENYYDGVTFKPSVRRYQSINVEGTRIATDLDSLYGGAWTQTPNTHTQGVVVTRLFTAGDSTLNVDFLLGTTPDTAPILNALTLQAVPEPSAMMLLVAGVGGMLLLRRRR